MDTTTAAATATRWGSSLGQWLAQTHSYGQAWSAGFGYGTSRTHTRPGLESAAGLAGVTRMLHRFTSLARPLPLCVCWLIQAVNWCGVGIRMVRLDHGGLISPWMIILSKKVFHGRLIAVLLFPWLFLLTVTTPFFSFNENFKARFVFLASDYGTLIAEF